MRTLPVRLPVFALSCTLLTVAITATLHGEPLKTVEGIMIATGDVTQIIHGDRVTSRVTFHFRDGSLDDEITIFSQRRFFRLISDHHIQRGPSFPKPIDIFVDAATGKITSKTQDGAIREDHFDLPSDVSNGLPPNLLLNILPSTNETKLSFVAPTARPRLISMSIKPEGEVRFSVGAPRARSLTMCSTSNLGSRRGDRPDHRRAARRLPHLDPRRRCSRIHPRGRPAILGRSYLAHRTNQPYVLPVIDDAMVRDRATTPRWGYLNPPTRLRCIHRSHGGGRGARFSRFLWLVGEERESHCQPPDLLPNWDVRFDDPVLS
jgi:hypothetical protein